MTNNSDVKFVEEINYRVVNGITNQIELLNILKKQNEKYIAKKLTKLVHKATKRGDKDIFIEERPN